MNNILHGSLFSGIGGFDLAAKWVGWENIFNCEINEFCRKILKYHFPNAEQYKDITKTDFSKWKGQIDILSGGFPCQPFSVAGKRKGTDDNRYLWPQMLRAIREIRPTWIVGENVAGIVSMVQPYKSVKVENEQVIFGEYYRERVLLRQKYIVEKICEDIEREGYSVQPIIIPACAVGAPHRRDRIWFIANRTDTGAKEVQCERQIRANSSVYAADTQRKGRYKLFQNIQSKIPNGQGTYRYGLQWNDTLCESLPADRWKDFPTQSPVCGRNDGLPFDVDDLTVSFSKWRTESIKAYGNAVLPQVAYEIFKAIDIFYK